MPKRNDLDGPYIFRKVNGHWERKSPGSNRWYRLRVETRTVERNQNIIKTWQGKRYTYQKLIEDTAKIWHWDLIEE